LGVFQVVIDAKAGRGTGHRADTALINGDQFASDVPPMPSSVLLQKSPVTAWKDAHHRTVSLAFQRHADPPAHNSFARDVTDLRPQPTSDGSLQGRSVQPD
jgi:hypothetical protein